MHEGGRIRRDPVDLETLDMPVLPDRYPASGPLGGVLGALELFAESDLVIDGVFVVACDLPGLAAQDLDALAASAHEHPDADVVVARTTRIEPTCAIWRPSATDRLRQIFESGERALHRAIEQLDSVEVALEAGALRNINTPDDLGRYP